MRHLLHIKTRPDELADALISIEQTLPETLVDVIDLTTGESADYTALLSKILAAESIRVW